ncbi:epoxide hydrolase family protein [Allonocardiopsis opalescens]|uniref:Pimeloyl-ACP methyl ester carboxylesterase n=1 Tax=Allonocardiopsis opalescens TaxID=1144618 RepID=A0A2T0Q895_9ACTN|nr:epoxide hydrolase family protein [Allonocardiopsis opalescens]PRY00040.1 pimeloyl-ACP methyl ester carboxylesterase [Allonocardiopsis opalescens]
MSTEIHPFRIDIPQAELDALRARLAATRWPEPLPGAEWSRGVPVDHLRGLAEYWADGFDWRLAERRLNAFPQFITEIDGQPIHFAHVRSPEPDALPLIMTHSWPNSIAEFLEVIGPLTDPRAHGGEPSRAFHVVAPSLPGFGFSRFPQPPDPAPWTAARVARTWAQLMARLGYRRYGAHGNDAGAVISPELAVADGDHLVGVHITGGVGIPTGDPAELAGLTGEEREQVQGLVDMLAGAGGSGYAPYLAARPLTLGYGFLDSPVAQLAYLVERFTEFDGWPQDGTAPAEPIGRDALLTNASLYWFTGTGASSSWTYYDGAAGMPIDQDKVPTGVSHGGSDAIRRIAERRNDIAHWSNRSSGSHMVAMAAPEGLVEDIREFFGALAARA